MLTLKEMVSEAELATEPCELLKDQLTELQIFTTRLLDYIRRVQAIVEQAEGMT